MTITSTLAAAKTRSLALAVRALPLVVEEGPKVAILAASLAAMVLMHGHPEPLHTGYFVTLGIRG